jgi:hypothetical protein
LRFQPRVRDELYRVARKVDRHTFFVEHVIGPAVPIGFRQPLNAERLVKLDLPELPVAAESRRELELYNEHLDAWERFRVDRFAVDGHVRLERCDGERAGAYEWKDLSRARYRWLVAAVVPEVPH